MPRFKIDWIVVLDGKTRRLKLNDEWSIRCYGTYYSQTIDIERRKADREVTVSGKLSISLLHGSQLIKTETFSLKLPHGFMYHQIKNPFIPELVFYPIEYKVGGFVDITENSGESINSLQNEQFTQPKCPENREHKKRIHEKSLEKLSNDFEQLLDSKASCFADATLKCGDATISAHKIILSARSPVFAAMFANPMKESSKNEVDITDIDVPTVRALLFYMYTGKTNFTDSSATDLLFAADKYQLQELKTVCSDFLKDTVSPQNVLRILVLGDMMDEDLKSFAVNYICNKCAEFSALENTEEWKTLQKERPALSMEVLTSLVKSMNEKLKR